MQYDGTRCEGCGDWIDVLEDTARLDGRPYHADCAESAEEALD